MDDLRDLLIHELQDLYDAEHRITKALPKMRKAAGSPDLQEAFDASQAVAALLEETLDEEKATDEKLTALAETGINESAADGDADEGASSYSAFSAWRLSSSTSPLSACAALACASTFG